MSEKAPVESKVLYNEAINYPFNVKVPLVNWLRSCNSLIKQANVYEMEDDIDTAYILYVRFADLFLDKISKSPEKAKYKKQYDDLYKQVAVIFGIIENLKTKIDEKFNQYQEQKKLEVLNERINRFNSSSAFEIAPIIPSKKKVDDKSLIESLKKLEQNTPNPQFDLSLSNSISYPSIPSSIPQHTSSISQKPALPSKEFELQPPSITSNIEHKTISYNENGLPLRSVFVPSQLKSTFLEYAKSNTKKKLETCGILCGKLSRNAFFINYLIIPEQDSTANTCTTKNEEKLFEIVDKYELFVLGWIHTHPTQSCFLSSVDLHTQNSYQIMLNEAIAMVCAPKYEPNYGIFRLTDPPGIPTVTKCSRSGFHPHEEDNLYIECERINRVGHVVIKDNLPFNTEDLR